MIDPKAWQEANDRYLATELKSLREALDRLANQEVSTPAVRPQQRVALWRRWSAIFSQGEAAEPVPTEPVQAEEGLPPAADTVSESDEPVPALEIIAQRLGLTNFERRTLLLCAAMEFDTSIGRLCAKAMRDPSNAHPTFAVALAAFDNASWDVMSPERPLRRWRLIEIIQPGAQPLITSAIRADERIVSFIKGLNYLDDRLSPLVTPVTGEDEVLPPSHAEVAQRVLEELRLAHDGPLPVLQLLGADSASKLTIARNVARQLGLGLFRVSAGALPQNVGDADSFALLWQREAVLMPVALYVDAPDLDREDDARASALLRLLRGTNGVIFLDTSEQWTGTGRGGRSFEVSRPLASEQLGAWTEALGAADSIAARLAGQFNFDMRSIRTTAAQALAAAGDDKPSRDAYLWRASLARVRPQLDQLAQPILPKASWDELELPPVESRQLRQIAAQVRNRSAVYDEMGFRQRLNRGLGVSVLFSGESGTGKTMAAEVIARDLDLLLYRIDLSGVVSKYIGETEKNLRKLFDAADGGGAILFFDEADTLFGKRSEVKDSHDRYANIEVGYLLQRMESFRGLAILTTNMKSALDPAFLRRLRFIVNFPFPGQSERLAIWRKVFPPQVRLEGIDFDRLARFNLTGGSIHNIALAAAFTAAETDGRITMPILLDAARSEYRKLGTPVSEADFQWLESVGGAA